MAFDDGVPYVQRIHLYRVVCKKKPPRSTGSSERGSFFPEDYHALSKIAPGLRFVLFAVRFRLPAEHDRDFLYSPLR